MLRIRNGLALVALLVGAAILGAPSQARATFSTIDFDISSTASGTISYAGNGGTLSGTGITVDKIFDSPTTAAPLTVTSGLLNFATGNYLGTDANGDLFFATVPSSSITITGTTTATGATTAQLTGVLTGTAEVVNVGGGVFMITETAVFSPTSPAVAAYFGDPTGAPYVGSLAITYQPGTTGLGTGGNGFSEGTLNGFISGGNVGVVPAPAPNGFILLGCGAFCLLGFAAWRRQLIRGRPVA